MRQNYVGGEGGPVFGWQDQPGNYYGHQGYGSYVLFPTGDKSWSADPTAPPAYKGSHEHTQVHETPQEAQAHALQLHEAWKATGEVPKQQPLEWNF